MALASPVRDLASKSSNDAPPTASQAPRNDRGLISDSLRLPKVDIDEGGNKIKLSSDQPQDTNRDKAGKESGNDISKQHRKSTEDSNKFNSALPSTDGDMWRDDDQERFALGEGSNESNHQRRDQIMALASPVRDLASKSSNDAPPTASQAPRNDRGLISDSLRLPKVDIDEGGNKIKLSSDQPQDTNRDKAGKESGNDISKQHRKSTEEADNATPNEIWGGNEGSQQSTKGDSSKRESSNNRSQTADVEESSGVQQGSGSGSSNHSFKKEKHEKRPNDAVTEKSGESLWDSGDTPKESSGILKIDEARPLEKGDASRVDAKKPSGGGKRYEFAGSGKSSTNANIKGNAGEDEVEPCSDDPTFLYKNKPGYNCVFIAKTKPKKCVRIGAISCPKSCNMREECRAMKLQLKQENKKVDSTNGSETMQIKEVETSSKTSTAKLSSKTYDKIPTIHVDVAEESIKNVDRKKLKSADATSDLKQNSDNISSEVKTEDMTKISNAYGKESIERFAKKNSDSHDDAGDRKLVVYDDKLGKPNVDKESKFGSEVTHPSKGKTGGKNINMRVNADKEFTEKAVTKSPDSDNVSSHIHNNNELQNPPFSNVTKFSNEIKTDDEISRNHVNTENQSTKKTTTIKKSLNFGDDVGDGKPIQNNDKTQNPLTGVMTNDKGKESIKIDSILQDSNDVSTDGKPIRSSDELQNSRDVGKKMIKKIDKKNLDSSDDASSKGKLLSHSDEPQHALPAKKNKYSGGYYQIKSQKSGQAATVSNDLGKNKTLVDLNRGKISSDKELSTNKKV